MDQLLIEGGVPLKGEVEVSVAKNSLLPILAAVLLSDKKIKIRDIPNLRDIKTILQLLTNLGVKVDYHNEDIVVDASKISSFEATYELVKTMRASILVLGPLLSRFKKAKVSLPGGCAIGARPIDIHLVNMEKMGANIKLHSGYVDAETQGLTGTKLVLSFPSVGATENLMMAATLASGTTIIENAALEPEIIDLGNFLNHLGAKIKGAGSSNITIEGVKSLNEGDFRPIGDRIEAATYLMAGAITKGDVKVKGIDPFCLDSVLEVFKQMGLEVQTGPNWIRVRYIGELKSTKVETAPFPGFPTDVQAQLMALATSASGTSIFSENIFENRFMHVPELVRMGAQIELKGPTAIVSGPVQLTGAPVMCTDLRASAALVLAALAAKGETRIQRIYHLDRGYTKLEEKLQSLGAKVKRVAGPVT